MSELKKRMNTLATKYKKVEGREKDKLVAEISKKLEGFVYSLMNRYKRVDINKIDATSVASLALLKALNKYDENIGNFDSYYGTWVRSEITREMINHGHNIKLPEYLNKPMTRIVREDLYDIDNPLHKELILVHYKLKSIDYDKIIRYRTITKELSILEDSDVDESTRRVELRHDLEDGLKKVFEDSDYDIVCRLFGFDGRSEEDINYLKSEYGDNRVNAIMHTIHHSNKLKELLEGYL